MPKEVQHRRPDRTQAVQPTFNLPNNSLDINRIQPTMLNLYQRSSGSHPLLGSQQVEKEKRSPIRIAESPVKQSIHRHQQHPAANESSAPPVTSDVAALLEEREAAGPSAPESPNSSNRQRRYADINNLNDLCHRFLLDHNQAIKLIESYEEDFAWATADLLAKKRTVRR